MIIIVGIGIDISDFVFRFVKFLMRKKVPSPILFVGFALVGVGLHHLIILSEPVVGIFEGGRWKWFLALLGMSLLLHVFIHIALFYILAVPFNIYHGRKLFDISMLPIKENNEENKKSAL